MSTPVTVDYAPLVFSRTAYVDFRPNFLAAPSQMSAPQRDAAKQFVQAATDYADKLRLDGPRWVMFGIDDWVVAGVVAEAPSLSREFLHERKVNPDGSERDQRLLFAFCGAAFRAPTEVAFVPPRAIEFYAPIYDGVVGPRFFERMTGAGWDHATECPIQTLSLPSIVQKAPPTRQADAVEIWPQDDKNLTQLWETSAAGRGRPSLCINAPSGKHKQWRTFDRITSSDAAGEPKSQVREPAPPSPSAIRTSERTLGKSSASMRPEDFVERDNQKKKTSVSNTGSVPILALAVGAIALAAAILLFRPR